MRKPLFLLLSLLFSLRTFSQTTNTIAFADTALKAGNHKVAIITYQFPKDIRQLQAKAIKNLKSNPEWADKFVVHLVEAGSKTIDFMDAYGLTRTEFDKMLSGFQNDKQIVFIDTATLKILRVNGIITFKGDSKLAAFNYLSLDTKKKQVIYDNYIMTREVELTGQKEYAPLLFGYETHWAEAIPGKKPKTNVEATLSIGVNSGDGRTSLCLIMPMTISDVKYLSIILL